MMAVEPLVNMATIADLHDMQAGQAGFK